MEEAMEGRKKFNRTSSPHSIQVSTCILLPLIIDYSNVSSVQFHRESFNSYVQ